MDMSNKSLALLLVAAIVISLGGTMLSLSKLNELTGITGMAGGPGKVELEVKTNISCNVDTNVSFGSSGKPSGTITLSTDKADNPDNFTDGCTAGSTTCGGIQINNTGNANVTVNFTSNVNGSGMLGAGASESDFKFNIDDAEVENNACISGGGPTTWPNVNTSSMTVCDNLWFSDSNDVTVIDFNITIDQNTVVGPKTATLTIQCEEKT